jgi:hypothetical protein
MYYSFDPRRHGGACAVSSWSRGLSRHLWNYALSSMVRGHRTHTREARILYLAARASGALHSVQRIRWGGGRGGQCGCPVNRLDRGRRRSWRAVRVKKHYRNQSCFEIGRVLVRCMGDRWGGRGPSRHPFRRGTAGRPRRPQTRSAGTGAVGSLWRTLLVGRLVVARWRFRFRSRRGVNLHLGGVNIEHSPKLISIKSQKLSSYGNPRRD